MAFNFSDVNNNNFFYESIDSLTNAGCATGYNDGTFRPDESPSRAQFAYWTHNCSGRVAFGATGDNDFDAFETAQLAPVTVKAGAQGNGTAFISLQANVNVYDPDAANCPCQVQYGIWDVGAAAYVSDTYSITLGSVAAENGGVTASGSVAARVPVDAGEEPKFQVHVTMQDANNNNSVVNADLTAPYVPFGGRGGNF